MTAAAFQAALSGRVRIFALAEEVDGTTVTQSNGFEVNTNQVADKRLATRLERLQDIRRLEDGHGVLSFWEWDKG